jgi:serine/threonine-protein kinase
MVAMAFDVEAVRPRLAAALGDTLQLGELLGMGGFAAVFRAHDPFLQRDVAVKVLDPALTTDEAGGAEFLREARIMAGVEHPHIVPLYAAEARDGLRFLTMRLLPGESLASRLEREGPLTPAAAVPIAREVASALAEAHRLGVVHRDIKPENVLLDASGHAAVTDFGIAAAVGPTTGATGLASGTPRYMSPEQALGEAVDGRADVYALGVMLFQLLTGELPFTGRSAAEVIAAHIAASPPTVSARRPDTPAALVALVDRMLAKEPAKRPTATEVAAVLARIGTPAGLRSPAQLRRRRLSRLGGIAALVLVTGGVVLVGAVRGVVALLTVLGQAGANPALVAIRPSVPDSVIRVLRARGALQDGEPVVGVFVRAGASLDDALVATPTSLVKLESGESRRWVQDSGSSLDLNVSWGRKGAAGGAPFSGTVRVSRAGAPPDTLLARLGPAEFRQLVLLFAEFRTVRDSVRRANTVPSR